MLPTSPAPFLSRRHRNARWIQYSHSKWLFVSSRPDDGRFVDDVRSGRAERDAKEPAVR